MDKNTLTQVNKDQLCLQKASKTHIAELQLWFTSQQAVLTWGGPKLSFPAAEHEFFEQLTGGEYTSLSLMMNKQLVGFGQYQIHPPFMHLGRLAINPHYRGLGLASILLKHLLDSGSMLSGVSRASLFVYTDNHIAYQTYVKRGFKKTLLPSGVNKMEGCDFLTLRV